jgi:succinate dehydrogenase / fumarate reductase cytochrome b subunit
MDSWQPRSEKTLQHKIGLPVLHVPQLVGLALGYDARELGLQRHIIRPEELIAGYRARARAGGTR